MCKNLMIPYVPKSKQKNLSKFIDKLVKPLTRNDSDGFGYMAIGHNNQIFAEKWLKPKDAFKNRKLITDDDLNFYNKFGSFVHEPDEIYRSYGIPSEIKSICFHARMATCDKGIENTHPFITENHGLIHNGVVDTYGLKFKQSTCDSEGILNSYIEHGVESNIKKIQTVAKDLNGYYACAVYAKVENDWLLDIFKDSQAQLYAINIKQLGLVFCTSASIVREICHQLKWNVLTVVKVRDNMIARFNIDNGEIESTYKFTKLERISNTKSFNGHVFKSINDYDNEDKELNSIGIS
jgi:predicted glutamine amidotransferase